MWAPPASTVWHWLHLVLKVLAPFAADIVEHAEKRGHKSTRMRQCVGES